MSDNTSTNNDSNPAPEGLSELQITRCDQTLKFVPYKITKGKNKNTVYLTPEICTKKAEKLTDEDKLALSKFLGAELWKTLIPKLNARAQTWTDEATPEDTNKFDPEKYKAFVDTFSARGESKDDLIAQRDELLALLDDLDPDKEEDTTEIVQVMRQIKSINKDIADKKRERKPKVATTPAAADGTPVPTAAGQ